MGQTLDTLPEHRTFSSLTTDDFEKLRAGGERGDIFINENTIANEMRDFKISDDFWSGLQATRQVMSRVKETGVRHVIGHLFNTCHFNSSTNVQRRKIDSASGVRG